MSDLSGTHLILLLAIGLVIVTIVLLIVASMTGTQISGQIGPFQIGPRDTQIAQLPTQRPPDTLVVPTPIPAEPTRVAPTERPQPTNTFVSTAVVQPTNTSIRLPTINQRGTCPALTTGLPLLLGTPYFDIFYWSEHYMVLYRDNLGQYALEIGIADMSTGSYNPEEWEDLDALPTGQWVNVHQFTNIGKGAFALCIDSSGLYGATVEYYDY